MTISKERRPWRSAGMFSALRVTGGTSAEQTLLFLGAGEAATGIADLVVSAMIARGLLGTGGSATQLAGRLAWSGGAESQ